MGWTRVQSYSESDESDLGSEHIVDDTPAILAANPASFYDQIFQKVNR